MSRLTKRISVENKDVIFYTKGEYENTTAGEMKSSDVREVMRKLAEYEDLEEQGLLKRFECAIGDTVYRISKSRPIIYECTVQGIKQEFNTTSYFLHANINEDNYSIWVDNWFDRCQIGYEFYLTKEEAEKALKELEGAE
jgi:hypothetical protein